MRPKEFQYYQGFISFLDNDGTSDSQSQPSSTVFLEKSRPTLVNFFNDYYLDYELCSQCLQDLQFIIQTCQDNNIQCHLFISPIHVSLLETFRATQYWSAFEDWKRALCDICPIVDFSGYNAITTNHLYYADPSHFQPIVGQKIFNRLLSLEDLSSPSEQSSLERPTALLEDVGSFGVVITPHNIEAHLQAINEARGAWAYQEAETFNHIQTLTDLVCNQKLNPLPRAL